MPGEVLPETWTECLAEQPTEHATLNTMLARYPAKRMTMWPVDSRVGNVKNNDPSLIEPVSPVPQRTLKQRNLTTSHFAA